MSSFSLGIGLKFPFAKVTSEHQSRNVFQEGGGGGGAGGSPMMTTRLSNGGNRPR